MWPFLHQQEQLIKELKAMIKSEIAGFAVPEHTLLCSALPKTRSGKIMRRILRKMASSDYDKLGDISTQSCGQNHNSAFEVGQEIATPPLLFYIPIHSAGVSLPF